MVFPLVAINIIGIKAELMIFRRFVFEIGITEIVAAFEIVCVYRTVVYCLSRSILNRGAGQVFLHGESASFLARNRHKRSLALDFRAPPARDILGRLVERSDVLIHNFRPGIMGRMGLDATQARARNPRLIYCSLSGYGQTGPRAHWPGQDLLVQAMGGIISTTGWEDGPPVAVGTYLADVTGALPEVWLYALGAMFVLVTLFLPKGLIGLLPERRQAAMETS